LLLVYYYKSKKLDELFQKNLTTIKILIPFSGLIGCISHFSLKGMEEACGTSLLFRGWQGLYID